MNACRVVISMVLAVVGCSSPDSPRSNRAPEISNITATPSSVSRGSVATITATVADADGDTLSYDWTLPTGFTIVSGAGTSQVFVTASCFASGSVKLTVNDGLASATAETSLSTIDGTWGTAELVETGNPDASSPAIAMDANGNAIAVWLQFNDIATVESVCANRYSAGTNQWGNASPIENEEAGSAWPPMIAMDAGGNAIAVWSQSNGNLYNAWANRYTAGTGWDTATLIETGDGDAGSPVIAMDAGGNAIVAWRQSDIWANWYIAGTGWGGATSIATGYGGAGPPTVMDANGNAMAVWSPLNNDHNCYNVWANRYNAGTGWGTATLLQNDDGYDASYPRIAMDASGNVIAVWVQNSGSGYQVWANRYTASTNLWDTATLIQNGDTSDATGWGPDIAMDASGNAIAVWTHDGGTHSIGANRYDAATGWGTATLIQNDDEYTRSPRVAMDPSGNAIAVWERSNAGYHIWANRYTAGGGWGSATVIENESGSALSPIVAIGANGNAIVVWVQSDGGHEDIRSNTFR